MKVLNLYSGIGGNRKLWEGVDVTAVEYDESIAAIYQDCFPNDTVIVGDAHEYLLKHYKEFDFVWASPPCPTHSRARLCRTWNGQNQAVYPDMKLWQEIIFLQNHAKGFWCVENVIPYYDPLIKPSRKFGRHLFWSNFYIQDRTFLNGETTDVKVNDAVYGFSLVGRTVNQRKDKILRNLVNPEIGLHILNAARGIKVKKKREQLSLIEEVSK